MQQRKSISRAGPRLPNQLVKELSGAAQGELHGGGRQARQSPASRRDRRKAERKGEKSGVQPLARRVQPMMTHSAEPAQLSLDKRRRVERQAVAQGQPTPGAQPRPKGANKFSELLAPSLVPGGVGSSTDAELALQRELARKLGMKRGKASMGDELLDELMSELGGVEELLVEVSGSGPLGPGGRRERMTSGKRKRAQREASSFDEGEEEDASRLGGGSGSEEGASEEDDSSAGLDSGSDVENSEGSEQVGGTHQDGNSDGGIGSAEEHVARSRPMLREEAGEGRGGSGSRVAADAGAGAPAAPAGEHAVASGVGVRYVPPGVRAAMQVGGGEGEDREAARVTRRVRGLLNRVAEANLQGIVRELSQLYSNEGRRLVSDAVASELLSAAAEGPRASERFAVVVSAAVAALAGTCASSEIIANFLARVAAALERALGQGQGQGADSLAAGNLTLVLAHLHLAGALKAELLYDALGRWRARFSDADVAAMAALLGAAGLALRAADPERMKQFVVDVHARAAQAGGVASLPARTRAMLELVVDVKNNRRRSDAKRTPPALDPAVAKWLKSCGVAAVAVGGITWDKVLAEDKRGVWWEPTAADAVAAAQGEGRPGAAAAPATAAAMDADAGIAAPELLRLAAAMRMNTDARRAVFCAVMGSEDCVDACEKLLRLGLQGEQEREVVRVAVECCLHEAAWNPYYGELLGRLCRAVRAQRVTLQYCLWDHVKQVPGMAVSRMTNLAKLYGAAVASGVLPGGALRVGTFGEGLAAKELLFWRLLLEHLLASGKSTEDVAGVFERIAAHPQLSELKRSLRRFLKLRVGPWIAAKEPGTGLGGNAEQLAALLQRCRTAERVLAGGGQR